MHHRCSGGGRRSGGQGGTGDSWSGNNVCIRRVVVQVIRIAVGYRSSGIGCELTSRCIHTIGRCLDWIGGHTWERGHAGRAEAAFIRVCACHSGCWVRVCQGRRV